MHPVLDLPWLQPLPQVSYIGLSTLGFQGARSSLLHALWFLSLGLPRPSHQSCCPKTATHQGLEENGWDFGVSHPVPQPFSFRGD